VYLKIAPCIPKTQDIFTVLSHSTAPGPSKEIKNSPGGTGKLTKISSDMSQMSKEGPESYWVKASVANVMVALEYASPNAVLFHNAQDKQQY